MLKKHHGIRIVITDQPENILERIRFYDIDSSPLKAEMTEENKKSYLVEIKRDITYFRKSYERADLHSDIAGLDPVMAARKIVDLARRHQGGAWADAQA